MRLGAQILIGTEIWLHISALLFPEPTLSMLTAHCQWEDETVRESTGHPPSGAKVKKRKLLALHTYGFLRVIALLLFHVCDSCDIMCVCLSASAMIVVVST